MISEAIVAAFHCTALMRRRDIFATDALRPITAAEDADTAAPGWVGSRWSGGTLLVGINPGGGGDQYRRNPTDDELYSLLRAFRDALTEPARKEALEHASRAWQRIQQGHNIWRIIAPILEATGETPDEIAFMNILPFRTRMDRAAPASTLRQAWAQSAEPQIRALQPRRIIALGAKAWKVLSGFPSPCGAETFLFKRGIGDSYIPTESRELLRALAARRSGSGL